MIIDDQAAEKHSKILKKAWPEAQAYDSSVFINKVLVDYFDQFSGDTCQVLDIGCGHNSDNLLPFSERIVLTGVDMDSDAIDRHPWLTEKYIASCENLPLPDRKYDVVFSRYSFEHFANKNSSVSEISRVLKEGGLLILLTVNRHALEFKFAKLLSPKFRAKTKNLLMNYPEVDTYDTNYLYNEEHEIITLLSQYNFQLKEDVHLMSTTSGFLRSFSPLCFIGAHYSRFLHKYNLRYLMSQMTIVAFKTTS